MGILTAIILLILAVGLFISVQVKLISNETLGVLANISSFVAVLAAILIFVVPAAQPNLVALPTSFSNEATNFPLTQLVEATKLVEIPVTQLVVATPVPLPSTQAPTEIPSPDSDTTPVPTSAQPQTATQSSATTPDETSQTKLLFEDNFADGLDSRWQVSGEHYIIDGTLWFNSMFLPADWKDYTVSIEYVDWCDDCTVTVGLRALSPNGWVGIRGTGSVLALPRWTTSKGDFFPESDFLQSYGFIELMARGNTFSSSGKSITLDGYPVGGLYIENSHYVDYTSFKLKSVKVFSIP